MMIHYRCRFAARIIQSRYVFFGAITLLCLGMHLSAPGQASIVHTIALDSENQVYPPLNDGLFQMRMYGYSSIAPSGVVGLVFRDVTGESYSKNVALQLVEIDPDGAIRRQNLFTVQTSSPNYQPLGSLAYDSSSRPHVFFTASSQLRHYTRTGAGWGYETQTFDLSMYFGGQAASSYSLIQGLRGLDGRLHLIFTARAGSQTSQLFQATLNGESWSVRGLGNFRDELSRDGFGFGDLFAVAVDHAGAVHLCFDSSEPYGDPDNLPRQRLNWARWDNGVWTLQVLRTGSDVDDRPAWNGTMALDQNGNPYVLAMHTTHATTGSMKTAVLYYYYRSSGGTWSREKIADQADGYVGGDGNKYTGEFPCLMFDAANRPHVLFADISSWHWPCIPDQPSISCNDQVRGQMRYAYKSGSSWKTLTLFSQPGRTASPNPLNMCEGHALVVSPGGSRIYALAMEHIHYSNTYAYDQEAQKEYRVILVEAANTLGSDPNSLWLSILRKILGHDVFVEGLDVSKDGAVDVGDLFQAPR